MVRPQHTGAQRALRCELEEQARPATSGLGPDFPNVSRETVPRMHAVNNAENGHAVSLGRQARFLGDPSKMQCGRLAKARCENSSWKGHVPFLLHGAGNPLAPLSGLAPSPVLSLRTRGEGTIVSPAGEADNTYSDAPCCRDAAWRLRCGLDAGTAVPAWRPFLGGHFGSG